MTQPPPKTGPRRDEGLLPDGVTSQDRKFFQGTSPHVYFETRLRTLAASLGAAEHAEAIGAGLRMGDFVIPEASEPLVTDPYAAVEVTNLFHHVGETVWRTFLCLRDDSSIRLALARLTTQRVRASLQEALASSPEALAQRLRVVLSLDDVSQVASDRVTATERLLRTAAYRLLEDAPLNNVTKHGARTLR